MRIFVHITPSDLKIKKVKSSESIDIKGKNILGRVFCTCFACEIFWGKGESENERSFGVDERSGFGEIIF